MASGSLTSASLLALLQLASPALPVGAYSYSEGLEMLVEQGAIATAAELQTWLATELTQGAIQLEAAIAHRAQQAAQRHQWSQLSAWNHWLSATRETSELRQQSWQMGQSLLKLLVALDADCSEPAAQLGTPCNYAIAYGLAAAHWQWPAAVALLAYLQSWAANLTTAGVKLVPLGQTAGQQILLALAAPLQAAAQAAIARPDTQLDSCSWGTSLASLAHARQYSRLFRS
ncbi:MAG: urease accessory protein UreF [Spirulinaceae cyanobacterium SM2_1_0]|nr:urease accessory protein UreF [Spirulinaceae cyanobacterium SM2_1_0]